MKIYDCFMYFDEEVVVDIRLNTLDEFVDYCKSKGAGNILLTVRAFNERARKFYERYGFKYDSDIQWNSKETGIIPGVIYRLQLEKIKSDKFFQF